MHAAGLVVGSVHLARYGEGVFQGVHDGDDVRFCI